MYTLQLLFCHKKTVLRYKEYSDIISQITGTASHSPNSSYRLYGMYDVVDLLFHKMMHLFSNSQHAHLLLSRRAGLIDGITILYRWFVLYVLQMSSSVLTVERFLKCGLDVLVLLSALNLKMTHFELSQVVKTVMYCMKCSKQTKTEGRSGPTASLFWGFVGTKKAINHQQKSSIHLFFHTKSDSE